jgi:hypothetical protein
MADKAQISDEDYNKVVFENGGSLVVNLGQIEEAAGFEVIPRGVYPGVVDEFSYSKSENSGAPMFTCICAIEGGDYDGKKPRTYFSFSKNALPYTKRGLKQAFPDIDWDSPFDPEELERSGKLLNRKVNIFIGNRKNDRTGEQEHFIQRLIPIQEGQTNGAGVNAKSGGKFFGG